MGMWSNQNVAGGANVDLIGSPRVIAVHAKIVKLRNMLTAPNNWALSVHAEQWAQRSHKFKRANQYFDPNSPSHLKLAYGSLKVLKIYRRNRGPI